MPVAKNAPKFARKLIALAVAGLAAATVAACDSPPSAPAPGVNPRQVTVFGSGQVQGVPDTLTADVGIEFTAPDVTSAMNHTNDRQQAVINALVGAGVDHKDISTTEVTLQPQFSNPEPNGNTATITGYRATNAITVKIHPPDAASRMLALIVGTGGDATRIKSVSYSIADDSQLVKDARARAFNDAKNRAEQYAQLSGLRLGRVLSISEATEPTAGGPPAPPRAIPSAVPLEPGQQTVSFSVTAVWELD
ncbi:MAG: SIMPL domain-containing protein [Mycobacterium sp.]